MTDIGPSNSTGAAQRLVVHQLDGFYGSFQALFDVSFTLASGEVLALIGANGAGKTTLLKTLAGILPCVPERIWHNGECLSIRNSRVSAAKGIAVVPEGRRLFATLTVEENLLIGAQCRRAGPWNLEAIYELFPDLWPRRHRLGPQLSGGQQQMVAIGRALMANPDLILLDELSLGLAPVIVEDIYRSLPQILKGGVSAILVEQDIHRALAVSHRYVTMREGRIVLAGESGSVRPQTIVDAYFGVAA